MPTHLLLKRGRPNAGPQTDLLVADGRITRLEPNIEPPTPMTTVIDLAGSILLPGFVDGHAHIDKTLLGLPWHANQAGPTLTDKIENERRLRRELHLDPATQSARIARQGISRGTTHMRTFVDIDTESGLVNFEGVLATREALRDALDMQIVAFPQSGLLIRPGTLELIDAAMRQGADVVGGLDPCGIDRDPAGQLNAVFGLAERYGAPVDIHLHDPGELGAFQIELIVDRTAALGMQSKVVISHAFCLGFPDVQIETARFARLIDSLVKHDIAIMTHGPGPRYFPPIARLVEAGVKLLTGSDGVRDTWGPFGNGDMLDRAWILSYRSNFRRDEEIAWTVEMATTRGAAAIAFNDYGLAVGGPADLVALDAETVAQAVMDRRPRKLVLKRGIVVARDGECLV